MMVRREKEREGIFFALASAGIILVVISFFAGTIFAMAGAIILCITFLAEIFLHLFH